MNARIRNARTALARTAPLTETQIQAIAPSVFAESPHESRGANYAYIPTIEVLRTLASEGFFPFSASQARSRTPGKTEYTKHMLRLRPQTIGALVKGGEINEIVLINSHDGTSSYQLLAGCFRIVCTNGLIAGSMFSEIRIQHSGSIRNQVIEAACQVVESFGRVDAAKEAFKALPMSTMEQTVFATAALNLRYEAGKAPIGATQILQPRRLEDGDSSLWTVFNRVQEHLTQGGLHGRASNGRNQTTRAINGIDASLSINRGLWDLASATHDRLVAA